jgi:hypothetical protein
VPSVEGSAFRLHSKSLAPGKGECPLARQVYEIPWVLIKKVLSEVPLCAHFAAAAWYRADVLAHGGQFDSTVDHRRTINHGLYLDNHRSKNVVLCLQMTLVGSSCKAGATNLTVDPTMLVVGGCSSWRFVFSILLVCVGLTHPSRNANHDFCLGRIRKQSELFKQSD